MDGIVVGRAVPVETAVPHVSVLADEVVELLAPRPGRVYCDGTLGAGGHAERVLEAGAPDARLIGIDRDPVALGIARARLARFADRVITVHGTFGDVARVLGELGVERVDGFVLDLGLSSIQLDAADRGFSFSRPGPIDMRMDPTGDPTALELIRRLDVEELSDVLRDLGEERYHRRIAQRLKEDVRAGRLATTADLARAVTECIPEPARRRMKIHPATLTFQALRIAVNRELDELAAFLDVFPDLLTEGGRCTVISFHSLEDRMVKHRFRDLAWSSSLPPQLAEQAGERVHPICRVVTRKAIVPGDDEVRANPRARSAKLRACERVGVVS
jgi:16S rRNA (cytosine1402-N4)-methyltransferase